MLLWLHFTEEKAETQRQGRLTPRACQSLEWILVLGCVQWALP